MKESFCCKTGESLSINCDAIESLCIEITNEKSNNIILNLTYRPPNGDVREFDKQLNKVLSTNDISNEEVIIAYDFNVNLVDFQENKKVQNFLNSLFGHSMMPVINKSTRVTKNTATAINQILINSLTTTNFKTGITKWDFSDNFPIPFVADHNIHIKEINKHFIFRRDRSDIYVEKLNYKLRTVSWDSINSSETNKAYDNFIEYLAHFLTSVSQKRKLN